MNRAACGRGPTAFVDRSVRLDLNELPGSLSIIVNVY